MGRPLFRHDPSLLSLCVTVINASHWTHTIVGANVERAHILRERIVLVENKTPPPFVLDAHLGAHVDLPKATHVDCWMNDSRVCRKPLLLNEISLGHGRAHVAAAGVLKGCLENHFIGSSSDHNAFHGLANELVQARLWLGNRRSFLLSFLCPGLLLLLILFIPVIAPGKHDCVFFCFYFYFPFQYNMVAPCCQGMPRVSSNRANPAMTQIITTKHIIAVLGIHEVSS